MQPMNGVGRELGCSVALLEHPKWPRMKVSEEQRVCLVNLLMLKPLSQTCLVWSYPNMCLYLHTFYLLYFIYSICISYTIFAHIYLLTHFYSFPCWFESTCTLVLLGPSLQRVLLYSSPWGDACWAWKYSWEGNWCQKKSQVIAQCSLTGWKIQPFLIFGGLFDVISSSLYFFCLFCFVFLICRAK